MNPVCRSFDFDVFISCSPMKRHVFSIVFGLEWNVWFSLGDLCQSAHLQRIRFTELK